MSDTIEESSTRGLTVYAVVGQWGGVGVKLNRHEARIVIGWFGFAIVLSDIENTLSNLWSLSPRRILGEMRDKGAKKCTQSFESRGEKVTIVTTREPLEVKQ